MKSMEFLLFLRPNFPQIDEMVPPHMQILNLPLSQHVEVAGMLNTFCSYLDATTSQSARGTICIHLYGRRSSPKQWSWHLE